MKKLRLITLFSGYDSQKKSLDYLGVDCEHWRTCEWAVKSIQALKDLHFSNDDTDYSKDLTQQEVIDFLTNKGISANYNEPMTYEQIKRLGEQKQRQIYNNIKASHNMVNIQQVKGSDLGICDTDTYDYIMTYSFPCQDLSAAGLGKGMARDSGTRSGMLWEVERILKELKESNTPLPKYLLMENVPQVHGTKNAGAFKEWLSFLESIEYVNSWEDMNSKECCIPQNRKRTFMLSVLNGKSVKFGMPMTLPIRLKDILEKNVDEKYYLSDKIVSHLNIRDDIKERIGVDLNDRESKLRDVASTIKARYDCGYEHFTPGPTGVAEPKIEKVATTDKGTNFNSVYSDEGISPTLLARDYKDPVRVAEVDRLAGLWDKDGNRHQAGSIYSADGLCPTLDTANGGCRTPLIPDEDYIGMYQYAKSDNFMGNKDRFTEMKGVADCVQCTPKEGVVLNEPCICASRGRNPENPTSRESGLPTEQHLELGPDGLSNTLTTVQKDNYVLEPSTERIIEMSTNPKHQQDMIQHEDGICRCIPAGTHGSTPHLLKTVVKENEESSFTDLQKQMITEDGNIKRYVHSDIVDEFNIGDCADISFPNGYGKGNRVCKQCAPTLNASNTGSSFIVKTEPNCEQVDIQQMVKVRKHEVDIKGLQDLLRTHKNLTNKEIAEKLNVPLTQVEHWFRTDTYFAIPSEEIWLELKALLNIETDTFDKQIMEFEIKPSEYDMSNRAYMEDGLSPTITTGGDSNIVVSEDNMKRQLCNHLIKEGLVKEGDVIRHSYTACRMEDSQPANTTSPGCCSTLDTRCDTLGVVVNDDQDIDNPLKGKTDYGWHFEQNVYSEDSKCCRSVKAAEGSGNTLKVIQDEPAKNRLSNYRIRKLTPRECFRLMGIKGEDFDKIAKNQSNAGLYHLAGDSIVTTCMMQIFGTLFGIDYKTKIYELLKDIAPNFEFEEIKAEPTFEKFNLFDDLL